MIVMVEFHYLYMEIEDTCQTVAKEYLKDADDFTLLRPGKEIWYQVDFAHSTTKRLNLFSIARTKSLLAN